MSKPRAWYRFENNSDPTVAEITVFDMIGDWIDDWIGWGGVTTAKTFGEELAKLSDSVKTIRVRINSPGGDVFSAVTIANLLRDQQKSKGRTVETIVDGLAASAASIIAMGGTTVTMADNALMMIHDPWTVAVGNASELKKVIDELDTVTAAIVATYRWHSELGEDDIAGLMDETKWMDADEAIALGFATHKVEGLKAAASIDRRAMSKLEIPEQFKDRVNAWVKPEPAQPEQPEQPVAATAAELLPLCQAAGASMDFMASLLKDGGTLEQAQARINADKDRREAAQQRERTVRGLCAEAKLPLLADHLVQSGLSIDAVKAHLVTVKGLVDRSIEIDGSQLPPAGEDYAASWKQAFAKVGRAGRTH